MPRLPRFASLVGLVLAVGVALLLPAPATGQDFDDLIKGFKELRDVKERFEDLEEKLDRERDRMRERERDAEAQRRNPPDVRPGTPPAGGPSGLYGPNPAPRPAGSAEAPSQYGPGWYGPASPYAPPGSPGLSGGGPLSGGTNPLLGRPNPGFDALAAADPPGTADAAVYIMRNPTLRTGRYQVTGVPGGPVAVQPVPEQTNAASFDQNVARGLRDAAGAQIVARQTLNEIADKLQDVRYALRRSGSDFPGGTNAARGLADRAEDAAASTVALAEAFRPENATFVSIRELGADGPNAVRLAVWSDRDYARLEAAFQAFEATVPRLAGDLANASPYLSQRAAEIDRLHLAVDGCFDQLRGVRGRLPQPGGPLGAGILNRRPVGGEERLHLFALAARLTERTADLVDAAAADPLLGLQARIRAASLFDGANAASDDPVVAATQVEGASLALAAALAEGADGETVAAADVEFERAWSEWQTIFEASVGRTGPTPETQAAVAAIEEVHDALHGAVPAAPGGGNGGGQNPAAAATRLATSAADFARQAPQLNLDALRRTNRNQFLTAASGLSAAAGYYAAVSSNAPVGSPGERRARGVLEASINDVADGLNELTAGGRGDAAANLARGLLADLSYWQSAVRTRE
ncbi:hypothetical protein [Alienimonas chondri]|uniref:Uncharacterized protein n=1 Tax=Alienimonas chondri TaxID=2681879 RepID=A0ABX1VHF0_9PLAN|nr:hypothetical protein [Alienimonas chondri]NNJ27229.1 hypothetical protein [Alienimonas chondri]